jgi:NAD-specific glutamate dehydrogenase
VASHPLRREIIVNQVTNQMVNRSGITYAFRLNEELGSSAADIARAYLVTQEVLGLPKFWGEIEELDHEISVDSQLLLLLEIRKLAERSARWLLVHDALLRKRRGRSDIDSPVLNTRINRPQQKKYVDHSKNNRKIFQRQGNSCEYIIHRDNRNAPGTPKPQKAILFS